MKSDYNGLVEQSEKNQSVDENFNNFVWVRTVVAYISRPYFGLILL
jgi:hypothetical protein